MLHQPSIQTAVEPIPALTRGWTPALKAKFLDRLAAKGNVRAACALVGLSTESAYRLRRRDADFARGWAAALALARDSSVQVLADRAIDGVEEQIYYRGELVGTRRRYDARLLLAHIARLDRLVDEQAAGPDVARFDELLACIAGEETPGIDPDCDNLLPPCRAALADEAGEKARETVSQAWIEAAGGKTPRLAKARYEAYLAECEDAAEQASTEAARQWDEWRVRACSTVDALCGWPGSKPAPGLPGNPAPAKVPAIPAVAPLSFPRTLSTVSTSALARALAGPEKGFQPPARSPFRAPGESRNACLSSFPRTRG